MYIDNSCIGREHYYLISFFDFNLIYGRSSCYIVVDLEFGYKNYQTAHNSKITLVILSQLFSLNQFIVFNRFIFNCRVKIFCCLYLCFAEEVSFQL